MDKILAKANGDFPFLFYIEKALPIEMADPANDPWYITGVASTPNIDHDMERMALPALKRMASQITYEGVPLRVEHQKNDNAVIGKIDQAWVDDSNKLWIKAKLDKEHPLAKQLHDALLGGSKLGLSVGGRVTQAIREMSEHQGKMIKTFFDVQLDEVSVTPRPSNYDAWLLNKHIISEGDNVEALYNTPLHNSFLVENPKFDYLMTIEKSIPKEAWTKVEDSTNNIMNKEYVTKEQFTSFSNDVLAILRKFTEDDAVGTTRMVDAPPAMEEPAHDQNNGTDVKETNPAQERTVKTGANGSDEHGQREANFGEGKTPEGQQKPHDEDNGTEVKDENPAQVRTVKSAEKRALLDRMAANLKKTSSTEKPPFMENAEKTAAGEGKGPAEAIYHTDHTSTEQPVAEQKAMPEQFMTDDSSTKEKADPALDNMGDREPEAGHATEEIAAKEGTGPKDSTGPKDEDSSHDMSDWNLPEVRRSRGQALDAYSMTIGQFIDRAEEKMNKGGRRIPGLRKFLIDMVRQDPEIQKSIREMMRLPGVKKSVIGGSPVTWTKDGTRYKLVPEDAYVQKSAVNKDAKFGDVYKSNFSSSQDKGMMQG